MDAHEALQGARVTRKQRLFCSYCGLADDEVEIMITCCGFQICGGCVDMCGEIVRTHRATKRGDAEYASWFARHEPPNV